MRNGQILPLTGRSAADPSVLRLLAPRVRTSSFRAAIHPRGAARHGEIRPSRSLSLSQVTFWSCWLCLECCNYRTQRLSVANRQFHTCTKLEDSSVSVEHAKREHERRQGSVAIDKKLENSETFGPRQSRSLSSDGSTYKHPLNLRPHTAFRRTSYHPTEKHNPRREPRPFWRLDPSHHALERCQRFEPRAASRHNSEGSQSRTPNIGRRRRTLLRERDLKTIHLLQEPSKIDQGREKIQQATTTLDPLSTYWNAEIARLRAAYDAEVTKNLISTPHERPQPPPDLFEEDDLSHHAATSAWADVWAASDDKARTRQWPDLMLRYLKERSSRIIEFLAVTLTHPLPNPHQVSDALDLMAAHLDTLDSSWPRQDGMLRLFQLICLVLRRYDKPFPLTQHTIYVISRNIDLTRRLHLIRLLDRYECNLSIHTLLQIATQLAKSSEAADAALDVLSKGVRLDAKGRKLPVIQKICTLILQRTLSRGIQRTYDVVVRMQELNIPLDIFHYNTIITNASVQGDYIIAWRIYRRLHEQGLEPDGTTFTVMSKLCRRTNDFSGFRQLYKDVHDVHNTHPGIDLEPRLIQELLYAIWTFEAQQSKLKSGSRPRQPRLRRAADFYARHCDIQSLIDLGIFDVADNREAAKVQYRRPRPMQALPVVYGPRPAPNTDVLATFVFIWIKSQQHVGTVFELYKRFVARLHEHDPIIVPLAANTFIWEVFLTSLSGNPTFLKHWPHFMRTMEDPFSKNMALGTSSMLTKSTEVPLNQNRADDVPGQIDISNQVPLSLTACRAPSENNPNDVHNSGSEMNVAAASSFAPMESPHRQSGGQLDQPLALPLTDAQDRDPLPINRDTKLTFRATTPGIHTWNIIVASYARFNEPISATKFIALLRSKKLDPDTVTWNTLIKCYRNANRPVEMLETLRNMKAAGHKPNKWTLQALCGEGLKIGRRTGLGSRARGGGLETGPRTLAGGFERVQESEEQVDHVIGDVRKELEDRVKSDVKNAIDKGSSDPVKSTRKLGRGWWRA